jgi:predicted  nucleic acid-binding Zn ribbon protein
MHVAQLHFRTGSLPDRNEGAHAINDLLAVLRMNGQICGREWPIAITEIGCIATALLPEAGALDDAHHNQYVRKALEQLEPAGLKLPEVVLTGEDVESIGVCGCSYPDTYVLYTMMCALEPPLRCGRCFLPIPLYRLAPTYQDEYYDIICWQTDYQACDQLQMNCGALERASMRQLSSVQSALSKAGLEICSRIHDLTGIPTFYYLYRWGARSRKAELGRRCPRCSGEWLLETPWHLFDFRCDGCHLVSNIAWDVR